MYGKTNILCVYEMLLSCYVFFWKKKDEVKIYI